LFSAADPTVLSLIGVTRSPAERAIKALAKAVPQCNRPQVEIKSDQHRGAPVDPRARRARCDGRHRVRRPAGLLPRPRVARRTAATDARLHPPAPEDQATVHLLSEAEPAQDNISAFALTPELIKSSCRSSGRRRRGRRFGDIYDDFRRTVHRIRDRLDMQIAYDLVWHSPIAFYFNGAFVRRGWVEAMVMGDSGQGKTEMAMELLRHYRLGERIQGEQTSGAGLIGGLEKMGDTWMLSWGRVPLNDKRLLIVDETQGLHTTQIEAMSDVRATGVAEITKIRTERTNARCRIVWLANPISGLTLAQHNQGVVAIKELFKKPEDVRRLDFAIAVASATSTTGDLDQRPPRRGGEPRYSSDLSRDARPVGVVRRPEQVDFSQAATDRILAAATEMGRALPRLDPARRAVRPAAQARPPRRAAAAARVYSTDETGERPRRPGRARRVRRRLPRPGLRRPSGWPTTSTATTSSPSSRSSCWPATG
jgi:hypothetical protein